MRTLIVGACLASVLTLSACSKTGKIQKFSEEELEPNPAPGAEAQRSPPPGHRAAATSTLKEAGARAS